jgi:hypothetical protein
LIVDDTNAIYGVFAGSGIEADQASKISCNEIRQALSGIPATLSIDEEMDRMEEAFKHAQVAIANRLPDKCTASAAVMQFCNDIKSGMWVVLGYVDTNCRIYQYGLRNEVWRLICLTDDAPTPIVGDQQALGKKGGPMQLRAFQVHPGDMYIATTAGAHDFLTDQEIVNVANEPPKEAVSNLVYTSRDRNQSIPDSLSELNDITGVVVRVHDNSVYLRTTV